MKIYHISQCENTDYDTYSDAVVCAESEDEARNMHPMDGRPLECFMHSEDMYGWTKKENVQVNYIGEAKEGLKKGLIISSYHAG